MGALVAVILMPTMGDGSQAVIYIAMLAAFIGGGIYACIHALLCVKFRANQVISGVVVNILAVALTTFLTTAMNKALTGGQSSNKFILGISDRFDIPGLSQIPVIGALFQNMYPFEWIILAIAVVSWYLMYKTRFGMHLRACGENPQSVDAAGGNGGAHPFHCRDALGRLIRCWRHLFCLFHLSQLLSQHLYGLWISGHRRHDLWQLEHPPLPRWSACSFGLAKSGGYQLCLNMGLPSNYSDLFMMLPYILTLLLLAFFSKKNHPPAAAGEAYDKGKR